MRASRLTGVVLLSVLLVARPRPAAAEWQFKPFLGATFGGSTTFVNLDGAGGRTKFALGVSAVWLGEVLGIEAEFGRTPGYFTGNSLVLDSGVNTLTGNLVVAVPRHLARYGLRPYVVGGAGWMGVRIGDAVNVLSVSSNKAAMDVGGGATGFFSTDFGVNWDVRYFRNIGRSGAPAGVSFGEEQLSFWRATMGFVVRY